MSAGCWINPVTRWTVLALCLGVVGTACQRKLPGPSECERIAAIALGVSEQRALDLPPIKRRFDAIVVECLTQPYDRLFLECMEASGRSKQCLREFQIRQLQANKDEPPP